MKAKVKKAAEMDGAPHRPLITIRDVRRGKVLVASTGPSAMARVCDGLALGDGRRYESPFAIYWTEICLKYGVNPRSGATCRKPSGKSLPKKRTAPLTAAETQQLTSIINELL